MGGEEEIMKILLNIKKYSPGNDDVNIKVLKVQVHSRTNFWYATNKNYPTILLVLFPHVMTHKGHIYLFDFAINENIPDPLICAQDLWRRQVRCKQFSKRHNHFDPDTSPIQGYVRSLPWSVQEGEARYENGVPGDSTTGSTIGIQYSSVFYHWILHQSGRRRRREQLNSGQCYKFININNKKRIQHMR